MISFHRGDPFQKVHSGPRSASSRCQRRIIGTLAGSRRREKRRWLALRRFAVRRSPYWGRSNFSPIGGRACEAWVRVAANSCARCPTVGPPHPRMSRAHEQLKYRTNSRSRTLVPVASILPSFLPFFLLCIRPFPRPVRVVNVDANLLSLTIADKDNKFNGPIRNVDNGQLLKHFVYWYFVSLDEISPWGYRDKRQGLR